MPETLDSLGEKIASLTTSFDIRFDQVGKRFDQVDKRFDQVDQRVDQVDKRVEQVDRRLAQVDARVSDMDARLSQVDARIAQADQRVDEQGSSLRTLIEAVDSKVGLVLEKVTHLMQRDIHNTAGHARFETRLDNHELRLIALEAGYRAQQNPPDAGERNGP